MVKELRETWGFVNPSFTYLKTYTEIFLVRFINMFIIFNNKGNSSNIRNINIFL